MILTAACNAPHRGIATKSAARHLSLAQMKGTC